MFVMKFKWTEQNNTGHLKELKIMLKYLKYFYTPFVEI